MWSFFVLKGRIMSEKVNLYEKSRRFFALMEIEGFEGKEFFDKYGLEFQKTHGLFVNEAVLIWCSAYTWEQFKIIVKSLVKQFNQKSIYVGKKVDDGYEVEFFEGDGLKNYSLTKKFMINKDEINSRSDKPQKKICLERAECLMGAYKRELLIKDLMEEL